MGASRIPAWSRRIPTPPGPAPGWGPGPQGWGPAPRPGRSRNTVILIAAAVAVLAIVLTVVLVSVTKSGGGDGPPPVSNKPDITALTDSMLLTEAEFPKIDGGRYERRSISTDEEEPDANPDDCSDHVGARRGGQYGGAVKGVKGFKGLLMGATVTLAHSKPDPQYYAAKCLPYHEGGETFTQVHLDSLPGGALGVAVNRDNEPEGNMAIGYIRGVLVMAVVDMSHGESPEKGKADVVMIFNRQAAKLNAA